jgi:ribosomal protein L15
MRYKATPKPVPHEIVNVGQLNRFADGTRITVEQLAAARLVKHPDRQVKLLGDGALTKRLTVAVHRVSASAKAKVAQAGGAVELIEQSDSAQGSRLKAQGAASRPPASSLEPRA